MDKRWKSIMTMKSSIVHELCYFFKQFMFYLIELCIFLIMWTYDFFKQNTVSVLNKNL